MKKLTLLVFATCVCGVTSDLYGAGLLSDALRNLTNGFAALVRGKTDDASEQENKAREQLTQKFLDDGYATKYVFVDKKEDREHGTIQLAILELVPNTNVRKKLSSEQDKKDADNQSESKNTDNSTSQAKKDTGSESYYSKWLKWISGGKQ